MKLEDLALKRRICAERLLKMHKTANSGHIGASLSYLEILVDLYFGRKGPRDLVIVSKGHGASALYSVLYEAGCLTSDAIASYYCDGTLLAAHPPCGGAIPEIPFGTGSLGHGLSLACGIAFSQRFTLRPFNVYCILSDGDCNEGSTWEAALFAAHNKLSNLRVIVDANGVQGFGYTKDILNLEPFEEKWRAFGFATAVADNGNDFECLNSAHKRLDPVVNDGPPQCLIARTVKGHSVSFMAGKVEWHYLPMTDEQFQKACDEQVQNNEE